MTIQTLNLTKSLYQYLLTNSLREAPVLQQLRAETAKLPNAHMQIAPEQAQLLSLLIELINARKTLEIGVFTGYSTLAVALALPTDGQVIACDINAEWPAIGQPYWHKAGVANKIDLRIAPALITLEHLINTQEANTFDFAFIDADKANYLNYYEYCLKLLRPGGLLAIDNVLWYGDVADVNKQNLATVTIRKLNSYIHQDARVTMSLLPMGDGLTLVRKR